MTSLRLGLRLALTPAARLRTALLVLAAMLGSTVILVTVAAGRHQLVTATSFPREMPQLVLVVVAVVGLPCAVLVATVARLSAALRDRRLANLRLIGMTPNQTRLVGAGEAGGAAVVGALLGWAGFWLVRPLLLGHAPAGPAWGDNFTPTVGDQVLVVLVVPALAILASVLPARASVDDALAVTRRAVRRPPGWWRLVPLGAGVALCLLVTARSPQSDEDVTDGLAYTLFAGVGLTALGMLLVLPVLVRLLTRFAAGRALGPAQRIAVRRLEAQPAGVARIIAALLIGLFLATGARFVLVAFESTTQYVTQARDVEQGQRVSVRASQADAAGTAARLADIAGVRDVVDLPVLTVADTGMQAIVATCADLDRTGPEFGGCRDGEAMWFSASGRDHVTYDASAAVQDETVTWSTSSDDESAAQTEVVRLPLDMAVLPGGDQVAWDALSPLYAEAIIPPSLVGDLPPNTEHTLLVLGSPGRDLGERLAAAGFQADNGGYYGDYDFVATMRSVIWTVVGVVLAVGLLALLVSAIDRVVQRRKEVVALQLLGLGRGVIRRAQALETAVPITIGAVLAVGLGALSGATYLSLIESSTVPWGQIVALAGVAVVGGLVVAGICTIACAPRLQPDEIRAE